MKELQYHGRDLRWEPINRDGDSVIRAIESGEPVVVLLEPGDATRYTLLLVPAIAIADDLRGVGIPASEAPAYLLCTWIGSEGCREGSWIPLDGEVGTYHLGSFVNEWSRTFLAWWFNELRERRVADLGLSDA